MPSLTPNPTPEANPHSTAVRQLRDFLRSRRKNSGKILQASSTKPTPKVKPAQVARKSVTVGSFAMRPTSTKSVGIPIPCTISKPAMPKVPVNRPTKINCQGLAVPGVKKQKNRPKKTPDDKAA